MNTLRSDNSDFIVLLRNAVLAAIGWFLLCFLSAYWNIAIEKEKTLELARKEALTIFGKDQAFRFWATDHGGVYVPATEQTPPNKYLSHIPERDITTPSGKNLTLMNPAYMLRQVMGHYTAFYSSRGHITSLKPLNPINKPDAWEIEALQQFKDGKEQVTAVVKIADNQYFRLMKPMATRAGCLKCHAHQGYKVGDVRGGVSVSIPLASYREMEMRSIQKLLITHLVFFFSGMGVIVFSYFRSKNRIIERLDAVNALREHSEKSMMFASSVVHDLKNPAVAIHSLSKLLRKNYQGVLDEKGRYFCDTIAQSAAQIEVFIEQINAYISAKEHRLTIKELDFLEICQTVREEYASQLQERNIQWSAPSRVIMIRADRIAILRILRNFLDNALKYGGDDLRIITVSYQESKAFHTICVFNDGNAIATDECREIFVQFKRNCPDSRVEGAGLGLTIIEELVRLHGGEVWGESDGRKGVKFSFTIAKKI